jgi:hypothetical protein
VNASLSGRGTGKEQGRRIGSDLAGVSHDELRVEWRREGGSVGVGVRLSEEGGGVKAVEGGL